MYRPLPGLRSWRTCLQGLTHHSRRPSSSVAGQLTQAVEPISLQQLLTVLPRVVLGRSLVHSRMGVPLLSPFDPWPACAFAASKPSRQQPCHCPHCDQTFETPSGLRTHIGKVHPGTVDRFVPTTFRQEHAVEGLPQCAACLRHFSQWKGRSQGPSSFRRLSGAG